MVLRPILFIAVVGMLAAAVDRYASPPGGLQLPIASTGEGSAAIRTGSLAYPREAIDSDNLRVRIPRHVRRRGTVRVKLSLVPDEPGAFTPVRRAARFPRSLQTRR